MKKILPGIRYNNENLTFERNLGENSSPIFRIYDLEGKISEEFGAANLRDNQILNNIIEINEKLGNENLDTEE